MKKVVKFASLLMVGGSLFFASCGKKSDDPTPTPLPNPTPNPSGPTVCQSDKKTTYVLIDASTIAGAANYTKNYDCNVTTSQGTDTIYLDIKARGDVDRLYMTLSQDNGPSTAYVGSSDLMTDNGKAVTRGNGSNYSYDLPGGISAFKLKIPVSVRTSSAAVADVYTIWVTNGNGDFSNPNKKTTVGPINVTLRYQSGTTFASASNIELGDQTATPPSYLSTEGQINAISGASIFADLTTDEERRNALNGADINMVSIGADGVAYGNETSGCGNPLGAKTYFIGVGLRKDLGTCLSNTQGTDMTKFSVYTGSQTFDAMTGADISGLTSPTADRVEVAENKIYVFQTADGRKGAIRVKSMSKSTVGYLNATATVDVKVLTK